MKCFVFLSVFIATWQVIVALGPNLICYYNAASAAREGLPKMTIADLEVALQFCTHLVYGYVGIKADNYQITSLNPNLDMRLRHFATVTALKERNPQVKFLLSVGGDHDLQHPDKYIGILEAGRQKQNEFITTAFNMVRAYGFDGLDLAFQLPRNKPRKVHSDAGMAWKSFKKLFTGDFIVDPKAAEHKEQFTTFVRDLKSALAAENYMLSLTVLPNVNSSWYFDVPALSSQLDMVNLAAFDFLTPDRNPEEADYTAPLYELHDQNRLDHYNVNFQVEHWLLQRFPATKINVGVATHGRAWTMTGDSGENGMPVVPATKGPAPAGLQTEWPGLLNWAEICTRLPNPSNVNAKGKHAPLKRVPDPTKRYGTYAFRAADPIGQHGIWVSYEDPDTAGNKAGYVKAKNLGGIALFDLGNDDFRGQCTGDRYPMLRAAKYRLLN